MEHIGTIPTGGIAAPDLQEVATRPGPVATVALAVDPAIDHAADRDLTGWRTVRRQLADQGATEATLDAIEGVIADAHLHGSALLAVAGDDGVRLIEHADRPPRTDLARWSTLADLAPFVERRQSELPHLIVVVDHAGADIVVDPGHGPVDLERAGGADGPLARSARGGDAQKRFQHRVEQTWEANAKAAAEAITELASSIGARLIVASGDPRSLSLLRDALAPSEAALLEVLDSSASGGGTESESTAVHRLVATVAARDSVAVLESLRAHLGRRDRAVEGAAATLDLLRQGAVEMLLVHDDVDDVRQAWIGPDPVHVALTREELEGMGVDTSDCQAARLVDASIRAALGTGATVRVVPSHGGPLEGFGALLRWSA